jgi:hypothetical protein
MRIIAFFTLLGVPEAGLTPTITILNIATDTIIINAASMTESTNMPGLYWYDFSTYDEDIDYGITMDGGATLSGSERYLNGANITNNLEQSFSAISLVNIVDAVWDEVIIGNHEAAGSFGEAILFLLRLTGNDVDKTGNIITIYKEDKVTPWRSYDVLNSFVEGRIIQ